MAQVPMRRPSAARLEMLAVERATLVALRDGGRIDDEVLSRRYTT